MFNHSYPYHYWSPIIIIFSNIYLPRPAKQCIAILGELSSLSSKDLGITPSDDVEYAES
jgi:hypothetical protein